MTDTNLLIFGCAVSFVAAVGAYVFIRESFLAGPDESAKEEESEIRRLPRNAA